MIFTLIENAMTLRIVDHFQVILSVDYSTSIITRHDCQITSTGSYTESYD